MLSGQAGKKVGWTRDDTTYIEIATICSADNQTVGDSLATDGDCKIDIGTDLIIWTKHFTTFVTYTETTVSTGGGSSGGGGGGGGGYVYIPIVATTSSTLVITATTTNASIISTASLQNNPNKFIFTKNLFVGINGSEILELQKLLFTLGFLRTNPNGYFGPATKQAVINFQIANKISPQGNVGPATRIALNLQMQTNITNAIQTASTSQILSLQAMFNRTLSLGAFSEEVLNLQKLLVNLGLLKATPNGYFGNQTKGAVKEFQKQNNILQTGMVGPQTRAILNSKQ